MEEVGTWRKASYSATNGNCIEVADAAPVVLVRDTTDRGGVTLTVPASAWQKFTATIKLARHAPAGTGGVPPCPPLFYPGG
jgi:hypothetical protein